MEKHISPLDDTQYENLNHEETSAKKPKWKRNYKACLNCRIRKIKCDLGPADNPHPPPCERCRRQQKQCLFTNTLRESSQTIVADMVSVDSDINHKENVSLNKLIPIGSLRIPHNGPQHGKVFKSISSDEKHPVKNLSSERPNTEAFRKRVSTKQNDNSEDAKKWRLELASMQNSVQFLANAAGSVAKQNTSEMLKSALNQTKEQVADSETSSRSKTPIPIDTQGCTEYSNGNPIAPLFNLHGPQKPITLLIDKLTKIRPKPNRTLSEVSYIGPTKLITETEAIELIELYFSTMHPYFPNIPLQLHDPKELAQYPILLCAILTISTRYHSFSEIGFDNGEDNKRNIKVHEKLWDICQRLISQTIWAEASTRSIGTVLAFIIFTEWNPRQIHWKKTDYGNSFKEDGLSPESNNKDEDGMTGIGAIRRSDRMSWMLTGSAIRLAQDMDFLQTSTKVFVAAHISDATTSMNMNQKSVLAESFSEISFERYKCRTSPFEVNDDDESGNIGNELFYLEQILKDDKDKERWIDVLKSSQDEEHGGLTDLEREFLNDEYVLYYSRNNDEIVQHHQQNQLPYPLKLSLAQRAKIELVRIMLIGYDTIYYDKGRRKLASNDQVHNLAVLSILSPLIEGWYSSYRECMKVLPGKPYDISIRKDRRAVHEFTEQIMHESLLCDYHYSQLYIYSLALQVDVKVTKLRVNEITRSAKYVELAYNAAKEILYSAVRVHRLKLLKYMPVKWVMRIVRAVSFLVKCYLTLTNSVGNMGSSEAKTILKLCCISLDETINVIKLAAITLKEATPDELHLAIRYSAILLYLCKEMNLKKERNKRLLISHGILVKEDHLGEYAKYSNTAPKYRVKRATPGKATLSVATKEKSEIKTSSSRPTTGGSTAEHNSNQNYPSSTDDSDENNISVQPKSVINILNDDDNADITPTEDGEPEGDATQESPLKQYDTTTPSPSKDSEDDFEFLPNDTIDWFSGSTDIGLGFVEPWTQMLEQRYLQSGGIDHEILNSSVEELYNYFDTHLDPQS
ncbi:transcriptional activator Aro80p [Monosporozyma servazzii]